MTFASVQELIQGTRQVIDLNGGVRVQDPAALRGETIDRLVQSAVFGDGDVQAAARRRLLELGPSNLNLFERALIPRVHLVNEA